MEEKVHLLIVLQIIYIQIQLGLYFIKYLNFKFIMYVGNKYVTTTNIIL